MKEPPSYGKTRPIRSDVTYAQIERAATDILKTGTRPTVEGVKTSLGGGSPRTIVDGLNRYWRDLGNRIDGNPDTMQRLPAAVADLAEGLWERAMGFALEAARSAGKESEDQLSRLKNQLELRQHTLSRREIEMDELLRARERTVRELEENLRAAITALARRDVTLTSLEGQLAIALRETAQYRLRIARILQRAVTRRVSAKPAAAKLKSRPKRSKFKMRIGMQVKDSRR